MKNLIFLFALTTATSAFASSLMEDFDCLNSGQKTRVDISVVNRPDFAIETYASTEPGDGSAYLTVEENGKVVSGARFEGISASGEVGKPLTDTDSQGQPCVYGSLATGIKVAAKITDSNGTRTVQLTCSHEVDGPHGGECQ